MMITQHAPFTAGPLDAKICFIGEAPGEDEARHGGAFIGRAGQELSKLCASAGINKEACRLENVFQFRPDRNDLSPYIKLAGKNPVLSEEFDAARDSLRQRLENCSANVFVPLGNVATYTLCGFCPPAITKRRGSIYESTLLPGRKAMPTIHPSSALRAWESRDSIQSGGDWVVRYFIAYDLKRAKRQSEFPEIKLRDRTLLIDPTFGEAVDFLEECRKHEEIAYDIECRGGYLSHIAFAIGPDLAMCIPFTEGATEVWSPSQESDLLVEIAKVLEDESVHKIVQNAAFDATFMYYHYGMHVRPLHDTMIAAAVLFPDYPKGLDFLVANYCDGEPYYKDDGKEWKRGGAPNEDIFKRYNAMDAAVLPEIFPKQRLELERAGNWGSYIQQRDVLHPLVYAGNKGMRVNVDGIAAASEKCQLRIEELQAELYEFTDGEINYRSTKDLIQYFYHARGIKPYVKRRKSGESTPTVDEKALNKLAAKSIPEAKIILAIRKEEKMKSTYYGVKLDEDNRFRCSFNPVGTVQERVSSSSTIRGTGGNAQNLPEDMRRLLIADEDYIIIVQDLAQAENRYVAYEANEEKMIAAIEADIDIHTQTGCLIHGIPVEECTSEIRADGKAGNHGLNYGLGPINFALHYGLTNQRGKWIHTRYHDVYPGIEDWHAAIRDELSKSNRTLTNCFGRKRTFLDKWGTDLFEKAYNFKPQSAIARIINRFGVCHLYYRQDLYDNVVFINQVHDSIWYEVPITDGMESIVATILSVKASLETPIQIRNHEFSIPVDTQIGFSVSKDAMLEWKAKKVNLTSPHTLAAELETYVNAAKA